MLMSFVDGILHYKTDCYANVVPTINAVFLFILKRIPTWERESHLSIRVWEICNGSSIPVVAAVRASLHGWPYDLVLVVMRTAAKSILIWLHEQRLKTADVRHTSFSTRMCCPFWTLYSCSSAIPHKELVEEYINKHKVDNNLVHIKLDAIHNKIIVQ